MSRKQLEGRIGYTFRDGALLSLALTHSSYANEGGTAGVHNERLEYLGDAALELISSDFLFHRYPKKKEGELSKLRASLVCEKALADVADTLDLRKEIYLGLGEERTGGRKRDSIAADAVEAVLAAIYLDGGLESARAFAERFILNDIENKHLFYDSKTVLQEIVQGFGGRVAYEQTGEEEVYETRFHMAVFVDGVKRGEGKGPTKKAAQQQAAYEAVLYYKRGTN